MTDERARHLHPASLVVATIRGARNLVAGGVALVVLAAQGQVGWALLGLLAGIVGALILPWLRWWRFTYRIGADSLSIDEGVLHRLHRSVPLERIQDISIEQGVIARVLGFATVKVETGGGQADDAVLDGVGLAEARRLRALLVPTATSPAAGAEIPAIVPLFTMGIGRVLLNGLLSFSLLLWIGVAFDLARRAAEALDLDPVEVIRDAAPQATFAVAGAALALILLLAALAGMVRALLRDQGFTLVHVDGRFRCTRGLAPRRETVIVDRRIQLALIRRKLLARLLGYCAVDFQTLGGSDDPSGRQEVAPLARDDEAVGVIAAAGMPFFATDRLERVDPRHGTRLAIRQGSGAVAAILVAAWFEPLALFLLLALPILFAQLRLAPRFHRYALQDGALHVAQGVLGRREWIVPMASVQTVSLTRGPVQRLLGLVTVSADTAGAQGWHRPHVVDLRLDDGKGLAAALLGRNQAIGA